MVRENDILVGRIALASGFITREELDKCMEVQKSEGSPRSLGQILLDKGLLTSQQLETISALQKQQKRRKSSKDSSSSTAKQPHESTATSLFGKHILEEGHATRSQLEKCLKIQEKLERRGKVMRLGEILVRKGYVTKKQVRQILDQQKKKIAKCISCNTRFNLPKDRPVDEVECPKCEGNLGRDRQDISSEEARFDQQSNTLETILGKNIGGCKIQERLGRGSMATVYKGRHLRLEKEMAVKILHPEIVEEEQSLLKGFIDEAKMGAKLDHSNIVRVFNGGEDQGVQFIHMEYIPGVSLKEMVDVRDRIDEDKALAYIRQVAKGLQYAHDKRIIHHDIKLSNLLLSEGAVVKITDFGISKVFSATSQVEGKNRLLGTSFYMAPELWAGKKIDHRIDLYALGICLYKLLTGEYPFEASSSQKIGKLHLDQPPESPRKYRRDISGATLSVLKKLLEKNPEDRYENAEELLEDLDRMSEGFEPRSRLDTAETIECDFCGTINQADRNLCRICKEDLQIQNVDDFEIG